MKLLITYIVHQVEHTASFMFIGFVYVMYPTMRRAMIMPIVLAVIAGTVSWYCDKRTLEMEQRKFVIQCLKEHEVEKLELMAQLPLALPGNEIWSKK